MRALLEIHGIPITLVGRMVEAHEIRELWLIRLVVHKLLDGPSEEHLEVARFRYFLKGIRVVEAQGVDRFIFHQEVPDTESDTAVFKARNNIDDGCQRRARTAGLYVLRFTPQVLQAFHLGGSRHFDKQTCKCSPALQSTLLYGKHKTLTFRNHMT